MLCVKACTVAAGTHMMSCRKNNVSHSELAWQQILFQLKELGSRDFFWINESAIPAAGSGTTTREQAPQKRAQAAGPPPIPRVPHARTNMQRS
jgi:hypothetical protein